MWAINTWKLSTKNETKILGKLMFRICSVDVICTNATTLIKKKSGPSTQVPTADFYKYEVPDASQEVHVILMLLPFCIQNLQMRLSSVLITDFIYNTTIRTGPFQTYLHVGVKEPTMGSIHSVPTSGI